MLPMKKRLSSTPAATFWPSIRPVAVTTPSPRPVRLRADSSFASYPGKASGSAETRSSSISRKEPSSKIRLSR